MKKLIAVLLVLIMVVTMFACGDKKNNKETEGPKVTTDPESGEHLPEANYKGADFRISTKTNTLYEVFTDAEDSTDICESALIQRNNAVEDRYSVNIRPIIAAGTELDTQVNEIISNVMSDYDVYDLLLTYVYSSGTLVMSDVLLDWADKETFKYTDFSQSYWHSDVNKNFAIKNSIYTAVGDMSMSTLTLTYCLYYNKTMGDNMGLTDQVLEAIEKKDWTLDYFTQLVGEIYTDSDEWPGVTVNDTFGYSTDPYTCLDNWNFALDLPMIERDSDGNLISNYNNERTISAIQAVNALCWENQGVRVDNQPHIRFKNNRCLFISSWFDYSMTEFANMDNTFIILPCPLLDESQEKYMTGAMDNYSMLSVPRTATETEMISVITEALNKYSEEYLYPAYYDKALKNKYSQDPITADMIDLVMEGRTFDMAQMFGSNTGWVGGLMRKLVAANSNDFQSEWDSMSEALSDGLRNIMAKYEENQS
jgi:hypothetical protein